MVSIKKKNLIIQLLLLGKTYSEIAKRVKVSNTIIKRIKDSNEYQTIRTKYNQYRYNYIYNLFKT